MQVRHAPLMTHNKHFLLPEHNHANDVDTDSGGMHQHFTLGELPGYEQRMHFPVHLFGTSYSTALRVTTYYPPPLS